MLLVAGSPVRCIGYIRRHFPFWLFDWRIFHWLCKKLTPFETLPSNTTTQLDGSIAWKCVPHYRGFVKGNSLEARGSPHKRPVTKSCDVCFAVIRNTMLSKQSLSLLLETAWRSKDATLVPSFLSKHQFIPNQEAVHCIYITTCISWMMMKWINPLNALSAKKIIFTWLIWPKNYDTGIKKWGITLYFLQHTYCGHPKLTYGVLGWGWEGCRYVNNKMHHVFLAAVRYQLWCYAGSYNHGTRFYFQVLLCHLIILMADIYSWAIWLNLLKCALDAYSLLDDIKGVS